MHFREIDIFVMILIQDNDGSTENCGIFELFGILFAQHQKSNLLNIPICNDLKINIIGSVHAETQTSKYAKEHFYETPFTAETRTDTILETNNFTNLGI